MRRVIFTAITCSVLAWCVAPAVSAEPLIAAGGSQSIATDADGGLWVWGYRGRGELGPRTAILRPVKVPRLRTVVAASVSSQFHFLALLADGGVRAWGRFACDG